MSSPLDDWQSRLSQHFSLLHRQRGTQAVFALEHGLNSGEIDNLAKAVRDDVAQRSPSRTHSLLWIVYAAEIGYGYSGDEYWQTFELKTPGWINRGDRGWLRDRFQWFHEQFGGAAPSGPWANHFSIICWPITHAILPCDLQRQLARILYELRHSFSADLFESPTTLGEFIAARSWSATSRFQNLAEEPQLIGQIAAALLLQGEFGTAALLHPDALRRIGSDLDRERMARGWLQTARSVAQERATVRGLSFPRGGMFSTRPQPHEARVEIATLGIEPRLVLRPRDQTRLSWDVSLEIPDLSQLLLRFPSAREVLTQSRCTVAGSAGRPLARGLCLYGSQRVILTRWPRHDEVLLRFDKRDPQLEALLRTECLLRPGPTWLFRIASDGLAYEVRNQRVRPGESYIVARANLTAAPDTPSAALSCEGVSAIYLPLPEALDGHWEEVLQQLGLRQAKAIEVWPAGLTPAQWDNDGHAEWLASERPCLGVRADHSVSAIEVAIGSGRDSSLLLDSITPGTVSFVELPQLPVGLHTITFSTRRAGSGVVDPVGDLEVLMRIRESRPWSQSGGSQGALLARVEPMNPTLEQLWDGRAEIGFHGPTGRQLKCTGSLVDSITDATKEKSLPPLTLPVDASTWGRHFLRHFQNDRGIATAYDTARACVLRFAAEELGSFVLRCERESTPLRWVLRQQKNGYELWLLNDSGNAASVKFAKRSFETPNIEEALPANDTYLVPPSGGLYVARLPDQTAAIIAPPVIQGLSQLGCSPVVNYAADIMTSLMTSWQDAELWNTAKVSGQMFGLTRQREVLTAIQLRTMQLLCGDEWAITEAGFHDGSKSLGYLQRAVWKAGHESEIVERLKQKVASLSTADMSARIRELAWVARFLEGPNSPTHDSALEWLAEFVLRAASDSAEVLCWAEDRAEEGISYLFRFPTFVRAARYMVVTVDRELSSNGVSHELSTSWRWR